MKKEDMIFDISSIWATVKEVFPYFDRLSFDWDEQYCIYLEKVLQVNEENDFHCILTEFMECLNDGHTKYIPPDSYREKKPFVCPDEPSYTLSEGVLTIKLNEFLKNHAAYVKDLLETTPSISLVCLDIRDNIGGNTYYAEKVAELFISGIFCSCKKWTQIQKAVDIASASQIVSYSDEGIKQYIKDGLLSEAAVVNAKRVMKHTVGYRLLDGTEFIGNGIMPDVENEINYM